MPDKITRREFMTAAAGSIVGIGLPGTFYKLSAEENNKIAGELRPDGRPRIPPGQHAIKALSDMGGRKGPGDVPSWRMKIYGAVENAVTVSLDDLASLKRVSITCDVHCVTGWTLLDSKWSGIPLKTIMNFVNIKEKAAHAIFYAPEDYSANPSFWPLKLKVNINNMLVSIFCHLWHYRFFSGSYHPLNKPAGIAGQT